MLPVFIHISKCCLYLKWGKKHCSSQALFKPQLFSMTHFRIPSISRDIDGSASLNQTSSTVQSRRRRQSGVGTCQRRCWAKDHFSNWCMCTTDLHYNGSALFKLLINNDKTPSLSTFCVRSTLVLQYHSMSWMSYLLSVNNIIKVHWK